MDVANPNEKVTFYYNTTQCEAREMGERLRMKGWNITRMICSPSLHYIQTGAKVITTLCAMQDHALSIDPSKEE